MDSDDHQDAEGRLNTIPMKILMTLDDGKTLYSRGTSWT